MKNLKFVMLLAIALTLSFNVKADHDQVITFDQLPAAAQALHQKYFADKVPLTVTMDWDDYTILYQSGEKVEFDRQGEWKQIKCRYSAVPSALIPEQIKANVKTSFPGTSIIDIDRGRRGYEVKLNNGLEIEYNSSFQVIDIDD